MKHHIRRSLALVLALCMVFTLLPAAASAEGTAAHGQVYLSDLDYLSGTAGDDTVRYDIGYQGKEEIALYITDTETQQHFDKGVFAHAASEIVYDISGLAASRFQAYAGVIENGTYGGCGFGVYTDLSDEPLWSVEHLNPTDQARFVDVEIPEGATLLILRSDNGTDTGGTRAWGDHSVWADAKLLVNTDVDELVMEEALTVPKYESVAIPVTALRDGEPCDVMINWESDNERVATVKNGVVTGLSRGEAVITASVVNAEGKTIRAKCTVTVGLQTYDLADGWELINGDDREGWSIVDENTVTILTQKGDYNQTGGEYQVQTHNLMLHDVEESDFTATVKMDYKPSASYESAGLVIYAADSANLIFGRRFHSYYGGKILGYFGIDDNQFGEGGLIADPSEEQEPIWLRMEKSGTSIALSYSLDGEEFIPNGDPIAWNSLRGDLKVGVWASDGAANNRTWATFSDLTIQYGEEEPVSVPFAAEAVDASGNRLVNPGFEDGLTGWTVNGNAGLASNNPFAGSGHYYTNGAESDYLYQTVTVPASGVYELSAAVSGSGILKLTDEAGNVLTSATHLGQSYGMVECESVELSKGDVVTVVVGYNPGSFYWANGDDVVFQLQPEDKVFVEYLSDWDWISGTVGYDSVRRNAGPEGKTISLIVDDSGKTKSFAKGLGVHAVSEVVFDIEGKGVARFQAYAGVNHTSGSCGFGVYTDLSEEPLWSAECINGSEKAQFVDVEIPADATRLILRTTEGGNGPNCDHSVWAEPIVTICTTADRVELDVDALQVEAGTSRRIYASAYTGGEKVTTLIRWASSDDDVATVRSGMITGVSEGTATITATVTSESGETNTASCEVTVSSDIRQDAVQAVMDRIAALDMENPDAGEISLIHRAYELLTDSEQTLVANLSDLEAAERELLWKSLDLGDITTGRLTLPVEAEGGTLIYWETSDQAHLTENGIATPETDRDVTVTLTATMVSAENTDTREFEITIPADPDFVAREKMNILQIGDSNTEFGFLTQNMKDIVNDDRGDYGTGFVTLCSVVTTWKAPKNIAISQTGTWKHHDMAGDGVDGDNPDSLNGLTNEGSKNATLKVTFIGSAADIYYLSKPGAGTFTVTVDGQDFGSFDADVAGDHLTQVAPCDGLKYGKHEMVITVTESTVSFQGVDIIVGDRDTRSTVHTWGNGTARAKDYAELNESVFVSGLRELNPNKVVLALGTNDHGYGYGNASGNAAIPAAEFEESLVTIIEMVKTALPEAEIWMMSTFETNDRSRPQSIPTLYDYWETAFPNAAQRTGINYWDMGNWFGEFDSIKMQDTWHVNSKYGKIIMQELYYRMSGCPMTAEELAAAIDALVITRPDQAEQVQDLESRLNALSEKDRALISQETLDWLALQKVMLEQFGVGSYESVVVPDRSPNGFDVNLTEKTTAGLTRHEGKVALTGWFDVDTEGADSYFKEKLSGENSYTAVTSLYIDSAMKNDPNHYHMVYSTGDHGTALRVEREAAGLRLNIFVYTGSGWVNANSGVLSDDLLDRWLDVACIYDAEANTIALWIDGEMIVAEGATGLRSTNYGLSMGYEPEDTLRKNNLKVASLKLFSEALTEIELDEGVLPPPDYESVILWYDYADYTYDDGSDAAEAVEALIDAIGEVTLESETEITAARKAYDALNETVKTYVTNYQVLVDAENALALLKGEPGCEHELVHVEAVEPGCHYNGNIEYWFCTECELYWQDEALTQLTNSKRVILPATGSENVEHVAAKEPTHTENGNIEYWHCADCEQYWQDEALTQLTNSKNVILPAEGCLAAAFTDVNLDAWYHEPIDFVLVNGMMTGDKEGTFRPDANITRAQVAQILYNMAEDKTYEASKTFSDVKDGQWFYDAVMWAAANGFVLGDDGADTFRPDAPITRQELVVIIWRYMGKQAPASAELTFADAAEAAPWAVEAIAWASENEFVKGLGDNKFAPKANASRAQMTQILMNIFG